MILKTLYANKNQLFGNKNEAYVDNIVCTTVANSTGCA